MEGPSLVIATIELRPFRGKKIITVIGSTKLIDVKELRHKKLKEVISWGKHLLLKIDDKIFRIHFLMFGSYRINDPKPDRIPRLHLNFKNGDLYFYSCSIRELSTDEFNNYDWSKDVMSEEWDPAQALGSLKKQKDELVCDVLMDQNIFAGVGNIIKNEILFRLKIHPETKIKDLSSHELKEMVKEAKNYCEDFFEWKVLFILKRNWKIMRKKQCPDCGTRVERKKTGKLMRWSYFCQICQPSRSQSKLPVSPVAIQ